MLKRFLDYVTIRKRVVFSDLTALDKETKLMWTRDANIKRKGMVWHNTSKFVKDLNKEKYAGYSDWRLPSKKEILTLIDFAEGQGVTHGFAGYFNEIGFKNVEFCCYWSSTTDADNTTFVWVVSVGNNFMSYVNWTIGYYFVWPVRSGDSKGSE